MPSPYENDKTILRDFSYSDVLIMIKILNSGENQTYESRLSKEIGYTPARLNKIIKYFKELGIIKETEQVGSNKMIVINKRYLKHFIDEQDVLIWLVENFLNKYNSYRYKDIF